MTRSVTVRALGVAAGIAVLGGRPSPAQPPDSLSITMLDTTVTDTRLFKRWVGNRLAGSIPFVLDFHDDTMLVVNDGPVANFWVTPDTLYVSGSRRAIIALEEVFDPRWAQSDSILPDPFPMRYRFSLDRLLLETPAATITMSPQDILARPLPGQWRANLPTGEQMLLVLMAGDRAWKRTVPGGSREWGSWQRQARDLRFAWPRDTTEAPPPGEEVVEGEPADSIIWRALYDAPFQLIFEQLGDSTSGITIFRRVIR